MSIRSRRPSPQTVKVLDALAADPSAWRYGYELGLEVGLRSGSLYPILVRLCDRDLLEAKWEDGPPLGRPPRHLYRLTSSGLEHAATFATRSVAQRRSRRSARASGCVIAALFCRSALDLSRSRARFQRSCVLGVSVAQPTAIARGYCSSSQRRVCRRIEWTGHKRCSSSLIKSRDGESAGSSASAACGLQFASASGPVSQAAHCCGSSYSACVVIALALVGYGLVHYPGLRSEPNVWGAMTAFLATLLVYIALTVLLSRGVTQRSAAARRYGLAGGLAVGVGWLLGIAPPAAFRGWVFLPLLIALLGPAVVAAVAGHRARDARTGTLAALWSGLVGGLIVFIVWVTVTYTNAGGPYDSGLVTGLPQERYARPRHVRGQRQSR